MQYIALKLLNFVADLLFIKDNILYRSHMVSLFIGDYLCVSRSNISIFRSTRHSPMRLYHGDVSRFKIDILMIDVFNLVFRCILSRLYMLTNSSREVI